MKTLSEMSASAWARAVELSEKHRVPFGVYDLGGVLVPISYATGGEEGLLALTANPGIQDLPKGAR